MAESNSDEVSKAKTPRNTSGWHQNPHLASLPHDFLYHLGISTEKDDIKKDYGDVKFVIMGGSKNRMKSFAGYLADRMGLSEEEKEKIDVSRTDRFSVFKVGSVLVMNHGMGVPSVTILLHEVFKLLQYANCEDVRVIRIGTSGGIGIPPGTVVISQKAVNATLAESHEMVVLGKRSTRAAVLDFELAKELLACKESNGVNTILGTTMCTDDFYEGQGRTDGALCSYSESEKNAYLQELKEKGVTNIEMEATIIGSMCNAMGVPGGIVCVTLVDRLKGDQVELTPEMYQEYQMRPQTLVANYILKSLEQTAPKV